MSGTFQGREQIFRFLARLPKETNGTYSSSLIDVLASDDRAAAEQLLLPSGATLWVQHEADLEFHRAKVAFVDHDALLPNLLGCQRPRSHLGDQQFFDDLKHEYLS